MKCLTPLLAAALISLTTAAEVPKIFAGLLEKGVAVRGQVGTIALPPEIDKYVAKVGAAARSDPKWYQEFSAKAKPGVPLPFDPKLGLTQEEYAEYLKLWGQREFKPEGKDVILLLRQSFDGSWVISCTGAAVTLSTIHYYADKDICTSPNGELKRIDDIKSDADSILGAWSGKEWKFEEETELGKSKENFALGRYEGGKFGLVVYRYLELSTEGKVVVNKSLVLRFVLGPAGHVKLPDVPIPGQSGPKSPVGAPKSKR